MYDSIARQFDPTVAQRAVDDARRARSRANRRRDARIGDGETRALRRDISFVAFVGRPSCFITRRRGRSDARRRDDRRRRARAGDSRAGAVARDSRAGAASAGVGMDAGRSERRARRETGACDDRRPCTEEEVRANEADADFEPRVLGGTRR